MKILIVVVFSIIVAIYSCCIVAGKDDERNGRKIKDYLKNSKIYAIIIVVK